MIAQTHELMGILRESNLIALNLTPIRAPIGKREFPGLTSRIRRVKCERLEIPIDQQGAARPGIVYGINTLQVDDETC